MRKAQSVVASPHGEPAGWPLRAQRYLFYGWRFRDADAGTPMERAVARRHNAKQAAWLPLYMLRWGVIGGVLLGLSMFAEALGGHAALVALLMIGLVAVGLFLLVTAICWIGLRRGDERR